MKTEVIYNWPNYAKLDYKYRQHHIRFTAFVTKRKLMCMECGGSGGGVEPVLDDGSGPWEDCGWCEGTGYMTPKGRGWWLTYRRQMKKCKS